MWRSAKKPVLQCDIHILCLETYATKTSKLKNDKSQPPLRCQKWNARNATHTMTDCIENVQRCSEKSENRKQEEL